MASNFFQSEDAENAFAILATDMEEALEMVSPNQAVVSGVTFYLWHMKTHPFAWLYVSFGL